MRSPRTIFAVLAVALAAALPASAATPTYSEPPFGTPWDTARLEILIVPPPHGQIVNGNGVLNGMQTNEADALRNSYVAAIEDGVRAWRKAIKQFGPRWLRSNLKLVSYVVGRDEIPQDALQDPEIVITTAPHQGESIGITLQGPARGVRCTISNARFFVTSFTYEDMFNVNTHELGHCLGIDHVVDGKPTHELMNAIYADTPGAAGNDIHCPSNLNVKVVKGAFGALFGKPGPKLQSVPVSKYRTSRCL